MTKDYHQKFLAAINDTGINDFLKKTAGYQKAIEAIKRVNDWVEQNIKPDSDFKEFDEIFSSCLNADETLWFNLGWHNGWNSGACQCLRILMENTPPEIDDIIASNSCSHLNLKPR